MVDQGRRVDDEVHTLSANESQVVCVQAEIRLADVADDDLEMIGGQRAESVEQLRIPAVEHLLHPPSGRSWSVPRTMQMSLPPVSDSRSQPIQCQKAAQIPVRAGQQHRVRRRRDARQRRGVGRSLQSMNLSSVRSAARTSVAPRRARSRT